MKKILLVSLFSILTFNVMAQEKIVQTAGRDQLGDFAPKFAELNAMSFSVRCGAVPTNWGCATAAW